MGLGSGRHSSFTSEDAVLGGCFVSSIYRCRHWYPWRRGYVCLIAWSRRGWFFRFVGSWTGLRGQAFCLRSLVVFTRPSDVRDVCSPFPGVTLRLVSCCSWSSYLAGSWRRGDRLAGLSACGFCQFSLAGRSMIFWSAKTYSNPAISPPIQRSCIYSSPSWNRRWPGCRGTRPGRASWTTPQRGSHASDG